MLLEGDQRVMIRRERPEQFQIQRFDAAHVNHRCVERLRGCQRRMQKRPEREDGDPPCSTVKLSLPLALAADLALTDFDWLKICPDFCANTRSAGIANRNGAIVGETSAEHPPALVLVAWNENHHIRNTAQVGNVVRPGMRGAVGADQARAIECKKDGQILQRHIMNQLIVTTLQERRINCYDRFQPLASNTRCEGDSVLFGDADIKIARRKPALELHQA